MKRTNLLRRAPRGRRIGGLLPAAALLALAWAVAGCSKEPMEIPGSGLGGDVLAEVTLAPEAMGGISVGTRALSGVNETVVKDLWVIQLNSAGTAQLGNPQYISSVTSASGKYTARVYLKAQPSLIYFIANTGNSTLYDGATTSALVGARTISITGEADAAPGNALPMAGTWTGTPTATMPTVSLTRAVAKVTFKLAAVIPSGYGFTLTSVKVCNAPKVLHPYRDPSKLDPGTTAANCYPATSAGVNADWVDITPSNRTLSATAKECGWCYLPENGRGTGSATDQMNKAASTALSGQGDYATYIAVRGTWKPNYTTTTMNVVYKFYLGSDAVKDYNVKRNTHYTLTATIKGASVADLRIEREK